MLKITVPAMEYYDEVSNEFILFKEQSLQLEHSLVSISKWEAKWHKPFLDGKDKTLEEVIDYVRCMTITQNVDADVYTRLTENNLKDINEYSKEQIESLFLKIIDYISIHNDVMQINFRLYGGWYQDDDLTNRASVVFQKISNIDIFPHIINQN